VSGACLVLKHLRRAEDKQILTWSAIGQHFSASTFRELVATHSCEVQTGLTRSLKQKTLNHWVVGSIPTGASFKIRHLQEFVLETKKLLRHFLGTYPTPSGPLGY
jgi:hypothetical protein